MATLSTIKLKRVYEPPDPADGKRILVERLWPRGLTKEKAQVDVWCKDIAPTTELRKWYGHQVERWPSFQEKYMKELENNPDAIGELCHHCQGKSVTFVYAAQDEAHNSAIVLKKFMESMVSAALRTEAPEAILPAAGIVIPTG